MHQVERALFDIRRGLPVVVTDGADCTLIQALEDGDDGVCAQLRQWTGASPGLLLATRRLSLLGADQDLAQADAGNVSIPEDLTGASLAELAFGPDPSPVLKEIDLAAALRPADDAERAGLALTRRALLLPAALAARVSDQRLASIHAAIAEGCLLAVPAAQVLQCIDQKRGAVKRVSEARVPLEDAPQSRFIMFRECGGLREHVAVVIGDPTEWDDPVPVRLHSACLTGDVFGSLRCDCGEQLRNAVMEINALGGGVLLYLAQEGRGIGLANKLRAYALQDAGLDTLEADRVLGFDEDERHYGAALDMLVELEVRRVRLLTNNPDKLRALSEGGIEVASRQGVYGRLNGHNVRYLTAKAEQAGHLLDEVFADRSRQE